MKITIAPEGADCTAHSFISSTGLLNILITVDKRFYLFSSNITGDDAPTLFWFKDEVEELDDIRVEFQTESQEERDSMDRMCFLNICKGQFHFVYLRADDLLTEKQAKWRAERD